MRTSQRFIVAGSIFLSSFIITGQAMAAKTVTVWYSWEKPFIRDMVKRYNQLHKNVEVKVQVNGDFDKFMTTAAAGSPPDCLLQFDDVVYEWASKGLIMPLDSMIKAKNIDMRDFADAAVKDVSYKGKVYGMPLDWDPDQVLYTNKQRFSEAGLDWTRPPVYLDELESAAAKLSVRDANGGWSKLGFAPWKTWGFYQTYWMGAFGGRTYDEDTNKVTLNSQANTRAFQWLYDYTAKYTYRALNSSASDFIMGKGGMMVDGQWMVPIIPKKMEWNVTKAPYPRDGKSFLPCSGWCYMIPKGAKNVKEAQDFITWMLEPKQAAEFLKAISWLPASLKTRKLPAIAEDPNLKWFVKLTEGKDDAIWMDPSPVCRTIWNELMKASDLVIQGKKSPKEALDAAQKISETDLKRAMARQIVK